MPEQLDQDSSGYNGGLSARTLSEYSVWQTFTAGITGNLSRIEAGFFNSINGTGILTIYDGEGTGGDVLFTSRVRVDGNGSLYFSNWIVDADVVAGRTYTFEFDPDPPGFGIPDPYGVALSSNGYDGGSMGVNDPSGTYLQLRSDWLFRTYVGGEGPVLSSLFDNSVNEADFNLLAVSDYVGPFDDAAGGNDRIVLPNDQAGVDDWGLSGGFHAGAGDDVILSGAGGAMVFGDDGDDRLTGQAAVDELDGGAGADLLDGADGNDLLSGGEGDDLIFGGGGADAVSGGADADRINGGDQDDWIDGGRGSDRLAGGNDDDRIAGQDGSDVLIGGLGDDLLFAGAGDDISVGGGGADLLRGDAGADVLRGQSGSDRLVGGEGADVIEGGTGIDRLRGGADSDAFAYRTVDFAANPVNSRDLVFDFSQAEGDKIDLVRVDAIAGGDDDAFAFVATSAFSGMAGELRYGFFGNATLIQGDWNGDGISDMDIRLSGHIALAAGDFIL